MSARGTGKSGRGGSAKRAKVQPVAAARKKVDASRKTNGLVLVVDVADRVTIRGRRLGACEAGLLDEARPMEGGQ